MIIISEVVFWRVHSQYDLRLFTNRLRCSAGKLTINYMLGRIRQKAAIVCLNFLFWRLFGDWIIDSKPFVRDFKRRPVEFKAELPIVLLHFSASDVVSVLSDIRRSTKWWWWWLLLLLLVVVVVFSPWASLGRIQSPVGRPVWLWYAASWASS